MYSESNLLSLLHLKIRTVFYWSEKVSLYPTTIYSVCMSGFWINIFTKVYLKKRNIIKMKGQNNKFCSFYSSSIWGRFANDQNIQLSSQSATAFWICCFKISCYKFFLCRHLVYSRKSKSMGRASVVAKSSIHFFGLSW